MFCVATMSPSKLLLSLGFMLVVCTTMSTAICPTIKSRSYWKARAPNLSISNLAISPAPFVLIHHTAGFTKGRSCSTERECIGQLQAIQNDHMRQEFGDIGYSFLIGGDGNIYEGRGWNKHGAHEPNYNRNSIGISLMGNFNSVGPTAAMISQAKSLIQCGVDIKKIAWNYKLIGHRQAKKKGDFTECPGEKLYAEIKKWKNWTASP